MNFKNLDMHQQKKWALAIDEWFCQLNPAAFGPQSFLRALEGLSRENED